jgi:hypothetical protein
MQIRKRHCSPLSHKHGTVLNAYRYRNAVNLDIDVLGVRLLLTNTYTNPVGFDIDGKDAMNFNAIPYQVEAGRWPIF